MEFRCGLRREPRYWITAARPQDLTRLPAIELAAARLLAGHAPESVLKETTSSDVLHTAQRDGRLWVALADDVAVGFAHVEVIERDGAHLEEIDVDPRHGRRGLGTQLVRYVCDWAAATGYAFVTLTTFRDVPWNMPFYARLGFEIVPRAQLSPALCAIVQDETRRGLDPKRRVVMRRRSSAGEAASMSNLKRCWPGQDAKRGKGRRASEQAEEDLPNVAGTTACPRTSAPVVLPPVFLRS
jgi:GNAT superfamily N-acetyltransferase